MAPSESSKTVIRGTGIVGGLTLLSRILGLLREVVFARLFGAGWVADAFFVAFRIPNLLRALLAEGALTSAFVPIFAAELKEGQREAQHFLSAVVGLVLIAASVAALLGMAFAPYIVEFMAPGFGVGTPKSELCVTLTRIMLPYIAFISLVTLINGALTTKKIFGASPLAQVVMNLVLTLAALWAGVFSEQTAVIFLSWSVIIGGILEIVVQVPALRRAKLSLRPLFHLAIRPVRQMLRLMVPALFGAAVYEVSIFFNTLLASLMENGAVSWLSYADRIAQLPIGVFTVALVSVLLPTLATAAASKDEAAFNAGLQNALRYTSFVMVPLSVGMFFYADYLVSLFFERGAFTAQATVRTALAVKAMSFGLWGVSCYSLTARAFFARKDTLTPALTGLLTLLLALILSLLLMGEPRNLADNALVRAIVSLQNVLTSLLFSQNFGHAGLALSSGLASTCSFFVLVAVLESKTVGLNWKPFLRAAAQSIVAAAAMLAALSYWHAHFPVNFLSFLIGTLLATVAYAAAAFCVGSREVREVGQMLAKKL